MRVLYLWPFFVMLSCAEAPNNALIADWDFDQSEAHLVADKSGHQNHAYAQSLRYDATAEQAALLFDGKDDNLLVVPISEGLTETATSITVVSRVYRTAVHNEAILAHGYPTMFLGFHGLQFKWQIALANGRGAVCYADPKYRAETERWYHIAASYNGWVAKLYIDGHEICSDWTYGAIEMPGVPFTIGGYLDDDDRIIDELSGRIDYLQIYRRALNTAEIKSLYDRSVTSRDP